jgi:hypothetical protein
MKTANPGRSVRLLAILALLLHGSPGFSQNISTVAGNGGSGASGDGGAATAAQLGQASEVAVDASGNLYIPDLLNHRIRRVDAVTEAAFDGINLISLLPATFGPDVPSRAVIYSFSETGVDQFGRVIEFPGQILEADILFNPACQFRTDPVTPAGKLDFQSRATHEIGHLLGLTYSGILSAVMSPPCYRARSASDTECRRRDTCCDNLS